MAEQKRAGRPPYPPEMRERAVRMVFEHQGEYPSQWRAIESISEKLSINHETLRIWVRRAETDTGQRPGLTTDERARVRELESEAWQPWPLSTASHVPGGCTRQFKGMRRSEECRCHRACAGAPVRLQRAMGMLRARRSQKTGTRCRVPAGNAKLGRSASPWSRA